jgi:hypothetical protein
MAGLVLRHGDLTVWLVIALLACGASLLRQAGSNRGRQARRQARKVRALRRAPQCQIIRMKEILKAGVAVAGI